MVWFEGLALGSPSSTSSLWVLGYVHAERNPPKKIHPKKIHAGICEFLALGPKSPKRISCEFLSKMPADFLKAWNPMIYEWLGIKKIHWSLKKIHWKFTWKFTASLGTSPGWLKKITEKNSLKRIHRSVQILWALDGRLGISRWATEKNQADSSIVQTALVGRAKTAALKDCHNNSSSYEDGIG